MEIKTVQALKAHLALNVRSVEQSTEFYRRMLGIEPCKVRKGYAKFDVQNPPLNLTLNENAFAERGALSHLGIQVSSTDDVLALRGRWREAGLLTHDEMGTNCCYAIQDKTWVSDPDGNSWEAFVVLEDNLAETTLCAVGDENQGVAEKGAAVCGGTAELLSMTSASQASSADVPVATSCCAPTQATVSIRR